MMRSQEFIPHKAYLEAESNAKKARHSHLTTEQRKAVEKSRPLIAMLDDEAASPHEKIGAYRRAGDLLESIIALPERPIMGILTLASEQ